MNTLREALGLVKRLIDDQTPSLDCVPNRLEGPGATFHDPERTIDYAAVLIEAGNPPKICRAEFDLRCREILAKPRWGDRLRYGRNPALDVPGDQDLGGRTTATLGD